MHRVRRPRAASELDRVKDTVDELNAFERLSDLLPANPREIKRIGNLHRLVKILIQRPDAVISPADQRLLVAWLIFCRLHLEIAERLLQAARSSTDETQLGAPELDALIEVLNQDQPDGSKAVLTAAQLLPGTRLAEAAAISSLFQEPEEVSVADEQATGDDSGPSVGR